MQYRLRILIAQAQEPMKRPAPGIAVGYGFSSIAAAHHPLENRDLTRKFVGLRKRGRVRFGKQEPSLQADA
ncbi:MAG: hypothetical protein J0I77_05125 [Rudaea sp.]|uniref:hypothetical protein n=1 Tax=unclassified Rudaea TaxID=2627037 RepID=UPI0010FA19F8|nr:MULTISPECIES: hypothetical protein [unclassified Rudaea]MBN8885079.1 hypothetical protein [Rudaea sp.]MBR0344292.1 hypothetical protein [Rudaea sp.]